VTVLKVNIKILNMIHLNHSERLLLSAEEFQQQTAVDFDTCVDFNMAPIVQNSSMKLFVGHHC